MMRVIQAAVMREDQKRSNNKNSRMQDSIIMGDIRMENTDRRRVSH